MNYVEIFTSRKTVSVLLTTVKYAFITVPLKLVFALFIAYILNFKIKFVNLFRTVYYIPSILGGSVAIAVLWRALFKIPASSTRSLGFFGIAGPDWLADKTWALFVICLLRVWQFGSAMVLFLAALKGVPADLYEAATIDGATKTRQFFSITVPMITPVIFYNLVTQIAQAFQEFNGPLHHHPGRPAQCYDACLPAGLQLRLQVQRDGHGVCAGLGHVHCRCPADCDCLHQPEALGLLRLIKEE